MRKAFRCKLILILHLLIWGGFPIKNSIATGEKKCHLVYDPNRVFQKEFLCTEEANELFQGRMGCNTSGPNVEKFHCMQEGLFWRFACCYNYNLSDYISVPHKTESKLSWWQRILSYFF